METKELHEQIDYVSKHPHNANAVAHAVEYIRLRWNAEVKWWFVWCIISFVAGLVLGIFISQFL